LIRFGHAVPYRPCFSHFASAQAVVPRACEPGSRAGAEPSFYSYVAPRG